MKILQLAIVILVCPVLAYADLLYCNPEEPQAKIACYDGDPLNGSASTINTNCVVDLYTGQLNCSPPVENPPFDINGFPLASIVDPAINSHAMGSVRMCVAALDMLVDAGKISRVRADVYKSDCYYPYANWIAASYTVDAEQARRVQCEAGQ